MRERLKKRKYLAGIMLVFVVATLVGLLRFGTFDRLKGQIKIKDFYLSNISTKLNGNVLDAAGEGPVVSKGFDEVSYELKYRLSNSNQRRDVTIVGTLDSDNGYASFKRLTGDNITSTLSNDNRRIEIVIRDVEADTEITTNVPLTINGAPNGYIIKPNFQIKESTAENFINVYTNPIEVNTNNLRGTVRDTEGNTISDIIISVYKNKKLIKETYTNQNGEYILSDLPEDNYTVKINEEIYKDIVQNDIAVKGDTKLDLTAERVYPFTLEIHKYITKVDAINLNTPILRTYDNASMVVFPVNKLTNLSGKVYYNIVVENTGEKEGIVSVVKDELPDYMSFDEKLNDGFELKDGIIYDRNLEGKVLKPGEKIIDTLVLNIENTKEARTYLNRVNSLGELYEHVVYILDDKIYKEEDVLEGEKIIKPSNPVEDFEGWYTDSEYTNLYNFNNIVTKDLILYGKTKQEQKIDIYPVRFHNDNDVTTKYVEYNNKVTPIDDPIKEHHIFKVWLDEEDLPFDFDTLIVRERDLYSSFEEVLPPKISHTPTMWTNNNVTVTLEKNENLVDDTGYSYLYKTSESSYSSYTNPFVISENTTIIAKGVKQEVDSVVTNHQIVNIDKLNPSITLFSENSVNRTSVVLNVSALDNESGINYYEVYQDDVKVGEKHLECYSETTFDGYETCRSNLPIERETTYTVTGLNHSTTYRFKVKVYDKAGNSVMSDEIEVTTITPRIVARLIGYNNSLFTDTVDENTGDVIVSKEDKYINFESLEEAFDYEDLYDCKNVQCTIQMVTNTDESVEVLEGQNLTLDLNGKVVSGINPEYTIKNNGDFTLIESTPETEDTGKIVNNLGVGILNKANSHLYLGEGYSDRPVTGSVVSVTRPYVYGETVGIKNETNGYFTMFDGKIVSPTSQVPGYGAVNGKVTGTEYSYTSISNIDTIDSKDYQVVTLSILVAPEARVNQSVYYPKLSSAMNSVNVGTTTYESDDTQRRLMQDLKSTGKYGFTYDENTDTWTSYTEGDYEVAKAYLIIDLTNESNNKSLNINYSVDTNYKNITSFLDVSTYSYAVKETVKPANITVNEYISNNNLGDSVPTYKHTETEYGFELEKGKIYIVNISHAKCYEDQIKEMTINDITLSDIETNHDKISTSSDISISSYGFYYDQTDRKIKSNNQYNSEDSTALGFIEIDLTNKEGEYNVIVDAAMESYASRINWNDGISSEGEIWIGENKAYSSNAIIRYYGTRTSERNVDVYDPVDYGNGTFGGYSTYGPSSIAKTLTGGKKYYLGMQYKKYVPDESLFPSREDFENANCSDQLIINSINVIKKSDNEADLNIYNTEVSNDNIIAELVENSNGGLVLDGEKYRTDNNRPNQEMNTSATIDLTNNNVGEMLVVDLTHMPGSSSYEYLYYNTNNILLNKDGSETDCTNCFTVFQKRTENGEENKYVIIPNGYSGEYEEVSGLTKTRYLFPLAGGYEYEIRFNTVSPSTSMTTFPNIKIETIRTERLTNVEGNYFNSIYTGNNVNPWFNGEDFDELGFTTNNYFRTTNYYKDSFIKIDLSSYDKNQLLSYDIYDNRSDIGKYAMYLTNNNRALTKEDLLRNKINLLVYNISYSGDSEVILEKGKVYYLHFADFNDSEEEPYSYHSSYGEQVLNGLKLTPIDESVMNIGNRKIFSGTYNIINAREEKYSYPTSASEEPTIIDNDTYYDFVYNAETGMYDAMNTEPSSVAIKTFKIDLTEATEDKLYSFQTNGGGFHNYYTYGDSENLSSLDINKYIGDIYNETPPTNYYKIERDSSVLLEKGKVHYIQVVTLKKNDTTSQFSFKITEVNNSNYIENYNTINEIREFNEKVDTVQLLKDVVVDETINVDYSEEVVLDVNGYTLSANADYIIENSGNLTISDTKYSRQVESYDRDLAEYQKYVGICDGCEGPSDEYKLDHLLDYASEFGIDLNNLSGSDEYTFEYTGDVQEFIAPESGIYKLQVWGAQGGYRNNANKAGKGGYSEGIIPLQAGEKIYVYVGGSGNTGGPSGGYNGGGSRPTYNGGGGATDMRIEGNSLYNRIIVAGGGGSDGAASNEGGAGGGLTGISATSGYGSGGDGGTQTASGSRGSFGQGGQGINNNDGYGGAGGGGWYGGGGVTPDYSADDESGGGGGSGYVFTFESTPISGYLVSNHFLSNASTTAGNESIPSYDGTTTMTGNEGDGYAKITCVATINIEELRSKLSKTYNVKTAPDISNGPAVLSNNSGKGIIKNNQDAMLNLGYINLSVSSNYGVYNEGLLQIDGATNINVNNEKSTGIENHIDGEIVNNGELNINIDPGCDYDNIFGATGISYSGGNHDLSNVTITGKNAIGVLVDKPAKVNLHSSNININNNACWNTITINNNYDNYNKTDSSNSGLYNKKYEYSLNFSSANNDNYYYDRLSGPIVNKGILNIDSGTSLVGRVENLGNLKISDGTNFNEIYQVDKYQFKYTNNLDEYVKVFENPNTDISNTVADVDQIINRAGTINIVENEGESSSLTSSSKPTILNFDIVNTTGGDISSIFNMGLLNSDNTDYNKLYNLHTYHWRDMQDDHYTAYSSSEDLRGIANVNGGTISTDTIVNENEMSLDNVTVQNGIINRGDLSVKGNSNITGVDKSAILNYPFKLVNSGGVYRFSRTSLSIGDEDKEATDGPIISSTNGSYAITGDCNPKGTSPINSFTLRIDYDRYIDRAELNYTDDNSDDNGYYKTYINSNGLLTDGGGYLKDKVKYPENADNLCSINYYDGKIQNTTVTDMTDVVDIPIKEVRNGYDILYNNSNLTGTVTIAPIDSASRSDVIDVNGTPYKSLETAINNAPNNSIISISGNYDSANKVIIPNNKTLTINYLNGAKVNSYSKDALITNNGNLTLSGDGTNNVIGITAFENNNNMVFNGVNNTDHSGNYDSQSNLVKNNKNLTINNVTSNGLDVVTNGEENTLTINDGVFNSNTIFGNDSEITVTGGYFDTDTNSNYYESVLDYNMQQSAAHYKSLFNINDSIVSINGLDTNNDSRYNSISREQNLGTFDSSSTLNLNNSNFGGKSSKEDIYAAITGGSTINVNDGTYDKVFINLKGSDNTYNQTAGTINGPLLASGYYSLGTELNQGYRNNFNITGGVINSPKDAGILLLNDSDSVITVGTKGDLIPGTENLKVSKSNPEIKGANYGLVQSGTYSIPNKLYFYDGIFKASGNPIDFHIEEVETGYDVVFNRNTEPKEKYLDILPVIYNKTTDTYYYDVQESFDEANTNDELIWIKDYTNYSNSPTLTVASSKKFTLYLSYLKSTNPVVNQGETQYVDSYRPYDGTITPLEGETVGASYIIINNENIIDPNTNALIEEVPFITNNGDLTIVAGAVSSSGNSGDVVSDSNFESVSGATIVKNNGTLSLNKVTSINIKSLGTMYENNGIMNIKESRFDTLQSNILTNNGTLNITGSDDSTSSCYNPTKMKVHITESLHNSVETAKKYGIDPHTFLKESIINNNGATMNIEYLNYDSEYSFVSILNNGTMDISNSSIEQYRNEDISTTLPIDNSIINNGTMTTSNTTLLSTKGIINTSNMNYAGTVVSGFDTGITNSGTLTLSGSLYSAGRGIYDTGSTNITGAGITTYREIYYGVGSGTVSMIGGFNTFGSYTRTYSVYNDVMESCENETPNNRTVNGTLLNPDAGEQSNDPGKAYPLSTGGVYIDGGRTLTLNGSVGFISLNNLVKSSSKCYKDGIYYEKCPAPYQHENKNGTGIETGNNYTVGAIEAHNANVIIQSGSVNGAMNNNDTYGIHSTYSNITQNGGYVGSMYVENTTQDVTIGSKEGNNNETYSNLGKTSCSSNFKGINFYSGNITLDPDKLCHFLDKEDNYIIYNPASTAPYMLSNENVIKNVDKDISYQSVSQAVSEASSGDTLRFLFTTSLPLDDYDVNVNKNITIDTNGKIFDGNLNISSGTTTIIDSSSNGRITKVTNTSGTLNVQSGTIDLIDNKSTANITGGSMKKIINSGTTNISNGIGKINEISNSGTLNISGSNYNNIDKIDTTGSVIAANTNINSAEITVSASGSLSIEGTSVSKITTNDSAIVITNSDTRVNSFINNNSEGSPLTLGNCEIKELENKGFLVINGTNISRTLTNKNDLTINSGTINELENEGRGIGNAGKYVINNANISTIIDDGTGTNYIYNGIYGSVSSTYQSKLIIEGGEFQYIGNTNGKLTFGKNDSTVNTNSPRVANLNANSYAISSPSNNAINFYDGTFTSTKPIVIDATIGAIPEGYEVYTAPNYDEYGALTGTYSMTLREKTAGETKIACVEGICYSTLQEAIDASVRNYSEIDGCPEVRIGDEFYFTVELDQDLVLDPQYQLTINLNSHNINDNGYNIPENITLINGSRNGTNLESSLSRFLANVFDNNNSSKDIIITNMSDGNALDSAKTYKLYSYNNGVYKPVKVISDGAGKYIIGNETLELKSIKGRIYINDLSAGEYMLKDNLDNELEFTIYNDGTISPNIKENITSNYGRVSASAVATLIVTIQTGIFRNKYILIGITIIVLAIIGLLLVRKNKSMKETI